MSDKIYRITGKTAEFRMVFVDATHTAQAICQAHGAENYLAQLLGNTLVGSLLLASGLKDKGVVQLSFLTKGKLSRLQADATPLGHVRAMIPHDEIVTIGQDVPMYQPSEVWVHKVGPLGQTLQDSRTEMISENLSESLTYYQLQSEQIKSSLGLYASYDVNAKAFKYCIGFLIEALPKIDEKTLSGIEHSMRNLPPLSQYIGPNGFQAMEYCTAITQPFEIQLHREIEVQAYCPCSQKKAEQSIIGLGKEEILKAIHEEETLYSSCDFCRRTYTFPPTKLVELFAN